MINYVIRPAAPADIAGIARVARCTWDATYAQSVATCNRQRFLAQSYSPKALHEAIEYERGWFYVATVREIVAGFAQYLRRYDAQGELVRIYVHPEHQRRGVGRAFLAIGLAAMAAEGIAHCYVSAEANNITARAFYERFGFRWFRQYGRFLGDQIIQLVEYTAPIASLLEAPGLGKEINKTTERM